MIYRLRAPTNQIFYKFLDTNAFLTVHILLPRKRRLCFGRQAFIVYQIHTKISSERVLRDMDGQNTLL